MSEKIKYVTGRVILVYPRLMKLNEFRNKKSYSVTMLIQKDSQDGKNLKDIIGKLWVDNKLSKRTDHNPLMDGNEYADEQKSKDKNAEYARGFYMMKTASLFDIKVIDGQKKLYAGEDDDISGRFGRVSMSISAYNNDGKGVTSFLHGVQILGPSGIEIPKSINVENDFDFEEVENDSNDELPF